MELEEARKVIRDIDEAMAALFVKRMEAARDIAAYKRAHGLPIEDRAQEARVLEGRSKRIGDPALLPYYQRFLHGVMALSKDWQRELTDAN